MNNGKRREKDRRYYVRHRISILKHKKEQQKKHKKEIAKRKRISYLKNHDKALMIAHQSRKKHRKLILKKAKEKRSRNTLKYKIKDHNYYIKNRSKILKRNKEYSKKYKRHLMQIATRRQRERRKSDINFRLTCVLRSRIQKVLLGKIKVGSAVKDLGCSIGFFVAYLQEQFYNDISWDNYGSYWEIDHIRELHTFDLTDRQQFLEACHYTNLQPLTIEDHKKKTIQNNKK
jgi:hypothetical protein